MIISKAHNFGFIHIPKCAGSTIRHQLRDKDDLSGKFYHTITLPEIGRINANHVRLEILEQFFPEALCALRDVVSYAIVREPHERFRSAVAQHMRAREIDPTKLNDAELTEKVAQIITEIENDTAFRTISNTVFFRQTDFIFLRGTRVVDHLFLMEDLQDLFDRMESEHGLTLKRDTVWNPTVSYRVPGTAGGLNRLKAMAQRTLPARHYAMLRDLGVKLFTTRGVPELETHLTSSDYVLDFVERFYTDDITLYNGLKARERSI